MTAVTNVFRITFSDEENDQFNIGTAESRKSEYSDTFYFEKFSLAESIPYRNFDLVDGNFADLMPSDSVDFLCSIRLKELLQKNCGISDQLQWFEVGLHAPTESRTYFVLHILRSPDILDRELSKFVGPSLAVPAFKNLSGHNVFSHELSTREVVFVRDSVYKSLKKAGLSGIDFQKVRSGKE